MSKISKSSSARADYYKATASPRAAYEKATASAWAAYEKATKEEIKEERK